MTNRSAFQHHGRTAIFDRVGINDNTTAVCIMMHIGRSVRPKELHASVSFVFDTGKMFHCRKRPHLFAIEPTIIWTHLYKADEDHKQRGRVAIVMFNVVSHVITTTMFGFGFSWHNGTHRSPNKSENVENRKRSSVDLTSENRSRKLSSKEKLSGGFCRNWNNSWN